jgi:hypothetical protein
MKQTYETPILIEGGEIVRETLNGTMASGESEGHILFKVPIPGGVGYYL